MNLVVFTRGYVGKVFTGFALILGMSQMSWAQGQQTLEKIVEEKEKSSFSQHMTVSTTQSFHKSNDYRKSASMDLTYGGSYTFPNKMTTGGAISMSQGNAEGGTTYLSDAGVYLALQTLELPEDFKWKPIITATLPTGAGSNTDDKLNGALTLTSSLSRSVEIESRNVNLSWTLSGKKNFHEYTLSAFGTPQTEYALVNALSASMGFGEKTSVSATFSYINGWTYRQFERKGFNSALAVSQVLREKLTLTGSLITGGAALKPNGMDSNIAFFDDRLSQFWGGLTYVF